jgi:peptidoglycan/LPS O-acetylase OafA/YrhL
VNGRAVQLDGLRAVAILAICWDHWRPGGWSRWLPFEVCLFFFLVMTGYLITSSLLRERDRGEAGGVAWRGRMMWSYQVRRGLRILAPYYVALAIAWLVGAPDMRAAWPWYAGHLSNIHMAFLDQWPAGTNHFWSLSMQQQFYLVWPLVIWWLPRGLIIPAVCAFAALGPISRFFNDHMLAWCVRPEVLTISCLDYFGVGALMAVAQWRGMLLTSPVLRWISIMAVVAYAVMFTTHAFGAPTYGMRFLQQTLLSVGLCGFIASGIVGFGGRLGKFLEQPALLRIGQLSYGIYLFHNLAPLVAGKLMPFLWNGVFDKGIPALLRVGIFAGMTWGMALASWRWIELPLQDFRKRMGKG